MDKRFGIFSDVRSSIWVFLSSIDQVVFSDGTALARAVRKGVFVKYPPCQVEKYKWFPPLLLG